MAVVVAPSPRLPLRHRLSEPRAVLFKSLLKEVSTAVSSIQYLHQRQRVRESSESSSPSSSSSSCVPSAVTRSDAIQGEVSSLSTWLLSPLHPERRRGERVRAGERQPLDGLEL